MSKSNYEIYAEKEQPLELLKSKTLADCIKELKDVENVGWDIENIVDFLGLLFNKTNEELLRLLNNEKYWIT